MDIWKVGGLEQFTVVHMPHEILLHRLVKDQVDQELYFSLEYKNDLWYICTVQRGRRTVRYVTPIYELAQTSACFLFHKYFMCSFEPYNWSSIDSMIKGGHLNEAIQVLKRDIPAIARNQKAERIAFQQSDTRINIIYCDTEVSFCLTTCSDAFQALRAYRSCNLMLIRFQNLFEHFARFVSLTDKDYRHFLKIFLL